MFDWNNWCYIDPQGDQLLFPEQSNDLTGEESFPLFNNWLDDIHNFTFRDTIPPDIGLSLSGDPVLLDRGFFDLEYIFSDSDLKSASYRIEGLYEDQFLFKDSLIMDESTERLISAFDTSGVIHLLLQNGNYNFSIEATDHFYNMSSQGFLLIVEDPPPVVSVISPVQDSIYSKEPLLLDYSISEIDFAQAWYSLDSGQSKFDIDQEGQYPITLGDGYYRLIVYAENIFGNSGSDTVDFGIKTFTNYHDEDVEKAEHIIFYPNPTQGVLNIIAIKKILAQGHII